MACHCFAQIEILSLRPLQISSTRLATAYCLFLAWWVYFIRLEKYECILFCFLSYQYVPHCRGQESSKYDESTRKLLESNEDGDKASSIP